MGELREVKIHRLIYSDWRGEAPVQMVKGDLSRVDDNRNQQLIATHKTLVSGVLTGGNRSTARGKDDKDHGRPGSS